MLFVITGFDAPDGREKRVIHRTAHLERLEACEKKGDLVLAGPLTDGTGSLIVMKALSREEAETFIQEDPYVIHGVFQKVTIHPFKQVFPRCPSSS